MNEDERKSIAFELIEMTAWAIKKLYGGTLPAEWKEHIKSSFDLNKRGSPTHPGIQIANREIAAAALESKTMIMACESMGIPLDRDYAQRIEELTLQYERYDSSETYNIASEYKTKVWDIILSQQRKKIAWIIEGYKFHGQPVPPRQQAIMDALGIEISHEERVSQWILSGKNIEILRNETQNPTLFRFIQAMFGLTKKA